MKYAFFPGCTVLGRGRNYEMSARAVSSALGIELVDIDDFECCGFPLKSVHYEAYFLMAARNILTAEEKGLNICTLCSACTGSLTEVNKHLNANFDERAKIVAQLKKGGIELKIGKPVKVKHLVKILYEEVGLEKIEKVVKKKLSNFSLAPHYGCHYLKPSDIYEPAEDPENPKSLEELITVTGARVINYSEKLKCCGAGILAINEDTAYSLTRLKLKELSKDSADALVLMCPFCSVMYDDNQKKIEQKFQEQYNLPVLYYPQVLGLAMGLEPKTLGLQMNRVSTRALLEKIK
ncbi:MAG: CoB--CoM heterodisulfide reductase iron-sulfur subunit B family protein [candidate division WOR-3 bacterium]|nr:CoB--CoM heterodisulfide reductase iron-sulfur subunit B family protein [candidate division WOR-3 bacterium]